MSIAYHIPQISALLMRPQSRLSPKWFHIRSWYTFTMFFSRIVVPNLIIHLLSILYAIHQVTFVLQVPKKYNSHNIKTVYSMFPSKYY